MTREEAIHIIEKDIQIDVRVCTNEEVHKFITALNMAISALGEQPRWISVEERLPEYSGRYIVLRKSGDCLDCQYEKDRDNWGVLIDMGEVGAIWVDYNGVTHWMSMPEVEV